MAGRGFIGVTTSTRFKREHVVVEMAPRNGVAKLSESMSSVCTVVVKNFVMLLNRICVVGIVLVGIKAFCEGTFIPAAAVRRP
jgi:hypothetical protein